MFLYAYVAYVFAFKCPDLQRIEFEFYQPEVCPKWWVFLSTDRLTPNVCLNKCFKNLFFPLDILLPLPQLFSVCCAPPFVDATTCDEKMCYFYSVDLNIGIN